MSDPMLKARALLKAQMALTRIELRAKARQSTFVAAALLLALVAFTMFNVAAFLGLAEHVGKVWSGFILAAVDAVLALGLLKVASGIQPGPEIDAARDLRDLVLHEIERDVEDVKGEIQSVRDDVQAFASGVHSVTSNVTGIVPGISSVVDLLTRALKKRKKS